MITQTACKIPILAFTITMLGVVSGCSTHVIDDSAGQPAREAVVRSASVGEKAAAVALQQIGVPYRYGGATASGFDCSGLVQYSYKHAGKDVPRTTAQLWSATSIVRREELQIGDLLFFSVGGKMSHVGMYVGGQRFVHAPSTVRTVTVAKLTSTYYSSAFIRGGRPK